ncbi:DUF3192 domain-containing protein [Shewanella cyperi]|uniref:DUF3192 domain-containing protein n=1 Tax=Shewanella cyperi TaxID=2814292 RepID=A0A974XMC1_9GAMM|nr:DUF3192 domain-containing protein [Shewanella cyperi]QSX31057.1 DUF3192 domain-containing protein [Shewanella cyperi]
MKAAYCAALLVASIGLSGCVVNLSDGDRDWSSSHWQKMEQQNRENLARLDLGMSKDQVLTLMGKADFNEAYVKEGKQIQVLFYRTQRTDQDGNTTKDECTPVVISDNKLVGWGSTAYALI